MSGEPFNEQRLLADVAKQWAWGEMNDWLTTENQHLHADNERLRVEVERLRAERDDIDALHRPYEVRGWTEPFCEECDDVWPCATNRALHPEETSRG